MSKTLEEVERFIELRARGLSFDKIAEETGTSKPTLLKWQAQYSEELTQAQYIELQNILSSFGVMRRNRVEVFSQLLGEGLKELKKRASSKEMQGIETDKLLSLVLTLQNTLEKELGRGKVSMVVEGSSFEFDFDKRRIIEVD